MGVDGRDSRKRARSRPGPRSNPAHVGSINLPRRRITRLRPAGRVLTCIGDGLAGVEWMADGGGDG